MRFRGIVAAFFAAWVIAIPGAYAQADERPPHEAIIEGVKGIFRSIFGDTERTPAPEPAKEPEKPVARPQPVPQPVVATPSAQVAPRSLQAAVAKGDEQAARRLIESGADIEAKDPGTGASVLHYAVMRGNRAIVAMLLARGADVNSRTKNGTTPLHTAVLYNHYEVAQQLLERGAELNAASASGATPLALASAARRREIAELLRSRGAK